MTESNQIVGSTLLEMLCVLALLAVLMSVSAKTFAIQGSLLSVRLEAFRLQSLFRESVRLAHARSDTITLTIKSDAIEREDGKKVVLKRPVMVKNPSTLSFYPTRVCSPYTVVLVSPAGECRVTLSLRARIKIACLSA